MSDRYHIWIVITEQNQDGEWVDTKVKDLGNVLSDSARRAMDLYADDLGEYQEQHPALACDLYAEAQ